MNNTTENNMKTIGEILASMSIVEQAKKRQADKHKQSVKVKEGC